MKKVAYFLIIFCFSVCGFSLAEDSQDKAQEHYRRGKEYSSQGDYLKANEEFKMAEELLKNFKVSSPKQELSRKEILIKRQEKFNAEVNLTLAKAYKMAKFGKNQQAMTLYLKTLKFVSDNSDIHYNLASFYIKQLNYWEATQELKYVIKINREDADAYYNLGILYEIYLNDINEAMKCYDKYLELKPDALDQLLVCSWIESLKKNKK